MANDEKCAHEICSCVSTPNSPYCSDRCKEADAQDMTEIACDCGHASCA